MKFIGLFLIFLAFYGLGQQVTLTGLFWFLIGLGFLFFDVISLFLINEIKRKRR